MSNSRLISSTVKANSGNYTKGRIYNNKTVKTDRIVLHHMAAVLTAKECGRLFQRKGYGASTHYGVGNDGKIALYVDEKNTAYANGDWEVNCKSVSIEISNSKTGGEWKVGSKALNSTIELVADIAIRNNLGKLVKGKNLVWHSMYFATACPGDYLRSKMDYIVKEANKLINDKSEKKPDKISVIYQVWDDVQNKWLPNVVDKTDYAGIFGHDVCAVKASLSKGNITYKVHYKGGKWLPAVKNRTDYAGLYNKPIDAITMKTDTDKKIYYRVHLRKKNKWTDYFTGYGTSSKKYAGTIGQEIDAIEIYLK